MLGDLALTNWHNVISNRFRPATKQASLTNLHIPSFFAAGKSTEDWKNPHINY